MNGAARKWTNQLLVWARTELEEQRALMAALDEQERCVSGGDPDAISTASAALVERLEAELERRGRLTRIFERLAGEMGLPASVLTLGSVAERLGGGPAATRPDPLAQQLFDLRVELRAAVERVRDRAREVAAIAGMQRSVVRDVLSALLSDEHGNPVHTDGTLIDAQA